MDDDVTAYDESYGGYGNDASRDFDDEASAVAYARQLRAHLHPHGPRYEPIRIHKTIKMDPSRVEILWSQP